MAKITTSDFETQQLAYLRRIVDALEHISLTLLNIAQTQTQHPSVGVPTTRTDPLTIEPFQNVQFPPAKGEPPKPMTQDIPNDK